MPSHHLPQGPPPGQLVMNFREMSGLFQMGTTPLLWIDEWPVPVRFGQQIIPIAAGRHRIRARTQYLFAVVALVVLIVVFAIVGG